MELVLPPQLLALHAQLHQYCQTCKLRTPDLLQCLDCHIGVYCSDTCHINAREPKRRRTDNDENLFETLPTEVIYNILRFLSPDDLKDIRKVARLLDLPGGKALVARVEVRLTDKSVMNYPLIKRLAPYVKRLLVDINNNTWWSIFSNVEELILTRNFSVELGNLPRNLKKLVIYNKNYPHPLDNLPESLKSLSVSGNITSNKLPLGLEILWMTNQTTILDLRLLTPNLKILEIWNDDEIGLVSVPSTIEELRIGGENIPHRLDLSDLVNLKEAEISIGIVDGGILFPNTPTFKYLYFREYANETPIFPNSIEKLELNDITLSSITQLPSNLKKLYIYNSSGYDTEALGELDVQFPRAIKFRLEL